MIVKLLTEHSLEFRSLKGGCRGSLSLQMSKCHIVGNHMHWLINYCRGAHKIHKGACLMENCEIHFKPGGHVFFLMRDFRGEDF